jgi:hypothetical protein
MNNFKLTWLENINKDVSNNGRGGYKLRKYKLLKQDYGTETYCKIIMSKSHRAAFAKFTAGVAPLRVETGRYEGLPIDSRLCPFCVNLVEDEFHTIFKCSLFDDIRNELFIHATRFNNDFHNLTEEHKFIFLFTNDDAIRCCARACFLILQRRQLFLSK